MDGIFHIGIDDTDHGESIGTGALARELALHLEGRLGARSLGVTRHQLLVHPDIPYTSHNSSACIEGIGHPEIETKLFECARFFLMEHFHEGANPGLCSCRADAVPEALVEIASRAQREVLRLDEFDAAVSTLGLSIWQSGATGQGRIGACAGVALRSTGEDGRFVGLRGIRDLGGVVAVGEILGRSGVAAVETADGRALPADAPVDTRDWVRPSLRRGRPVLVVCEEDGGWVPGERRSKDD